MPSNAGTAIWSTSLSTLACIVLTSGLISLNACGQTQSAGSPSSSPQQQIDALKRENDSLREENRVLRKLLAEK